MVKDDVKPVWLWRVGSRRSIRHQSTCVLLWFVPVVLLPYINTDVIFMLYKHVMSIDITYIILLVYIMEKTSIIYHVSFELSVPYALPCLLCGGQIFVFSSFF